MATEASVFGSERKLFGVDHQEIGAELLAGWGLPETISTMIRYHHASDCPEAIRMPVDILYWSTMLASIYYVWFTECRKGAEAQGGHLSPLLGQ
jgi:HD-like signal output (HDOD) protein